MIFLITLELNHSLNICSLRVDKEYEIMDLFEGWP